MNLTCLIYEYTKGIRVEKVWTNFCTVISASELFIFCTNEPPIVYSPNNVPAMNVDPGMADAIVTWSPLPSANDTVDGPIPPSTIVCEVSPGNVVMSGDRFLVGTTTVTCRANDTALNEGSSQFNITVIGMFHLHLLLSFYKQE